MIYGTSHRCSREKYVAFDSVVLPLMTEFTYFSSLVIRDRIRVIPIEMPSFPTGIWLVFRE